MTGYGSTGGLIGAGGAGAVAVTGFNALSLSVLAASLFLLGLLALRLAMVGRRSER